HKDLGEQLGLFYSSRYLHAASLYTAGKKAEAKKLFLELYDDAARDGVVPPIDGSFRQALNDGAAEDTEPFVDFLRRRHAKLLEDKRPLAALALTWQTHQMGETGLAGELFQRTIAGVPENEQVFVRLAGLEYLWHTGQYAHADAELQKVLDEPD